MSTEHPEIIIERNAVMLTDDGASLYADIFRPDDDTKHPAILMRQPYSKDLSKSWGFYDAEFFARSGFGVVIQDCRGFGVSDGEPSMNHYEGEDGREAVEWVAGLPWCSGSVCMMGLSYYGSTQLQAAQEQPTHLKAIAPFMVMGGFGSAYFQPSIPFWLYSQYEQAMKLGKYPNDQSLLKRMHDTLSKQDFLYELPEFCNSAITGVPEFPHIRDDNQERFLHIGDHEFWSGIGWEIDYEKIDVPCLFGTGWYDVAKSVTFDHYLQTVSKSRSEKVRADSRLIIGPWLHGEMLLTEFGGVDFGHDSSDDHSLLKRRHLEFYEHLCSEGNSDRPKQLPVLAFLLGANEWKEYSAWPPEEAESECFYLCSGTGAVKDGRLTADAPQKPSADFYRYDPACPMPGRGRDPLTGDESLFIESLHERPDDIVYTSEELTEDLNVTGMVKMTLFASSSAVDTDFCCRLSDVYPDGRALLLTYGMVRARFRDSWKAPSLLAPGQTVRYEVDMSGISNLFRKGHRIRIDITSSCFPEFNRNHNTADAPGYGTELITADQTVFCGGEHASYISLPVIRQR